MNCKGFLSVLLLPLFVTHAEAADVVAFPGAQGWGRWAKGARATATASVYHVTNLNDSGSGSFRDAVSQTNRIVVFDVSGVIQISSRITFKPNLYIAGQTAPGEGVTIYGDGVSFSSADNLICRYLRVRMGHGGSAGKDCAGISNGTNMIFDHCSFSWGLDETFSINPDGKGALGNITIQNTVIGQGLMTHSAGGLIQADNITLYRNLYVDNSTRNNKVKGISQYANNIVYNWKNGCYIMGGDSEGTSHVNIESNLFINGPAGGGNAFTEANERFYCYGIDNWQDRNCDGKLNPSEVTDYNACTRVYTPYDYPELSLYKGNELIEKLLPEVGATLPYRDQADCYMVDEVLSFGTKGALITYETSLPIGAPSTWSWWKGVKPADTDGDGMPDEWEIANGTDPAKADATVLAANGYLNIENYINALTAENRPFFLRRPITLSSRSETTTSVTIEWRDYTELEDGFAVEVESNGIWQEVARVQANATACEIRDLQSATGYKIRVRAFAQKDGETVYSEYSNVCIVETRPVLADEIDIDTYQPDVVNEVEVAEGQYLLLEAQKGQTLDYTLPNEILPAHVVAAGAGVINVNGAAIGGIGTTVNKDNEGLLVLNNKNKYTGATITRGGTIQFATIANGGIESSIGASVAAAQNWVFDSGTYSYIGPSASSNRSARIDRDGTLAIENAGTTLTMSGVFEGKGGLILDGKGTLSIADTKFFGYEGATTLKGGKIYLSDTENACKTFGAMTKPVILAGGCLQFASKNEDYQTHSFPVIVEEGTTSILSMPTHCYFKSKIEGNGVLQFDLPYVRAYLKPNLSDFTGKLIGNGTKSGALMMNEDQWNTPQVCFELKNGVTLASWASNATNYLGGLSGDVGTFLAGTSKQSKGFSCTWVVGSANSDETFHGVINNLPAGGNSAYSGTVAITKVGAGIWRLTGANVYSGATRITEGTLVVNGRHTGTGVVTVASEAVLMGKGTLSGKVTVQRDGILCPGDTLIDGSNLKLLAGLSLSSGSVLRIPLAVDKEGTLLLNAVSVDGGITIGQGATLELDMTLVPDYLFKRGDAIPVLRNSNITTGSGSFQIVPASPGEGLEWETSTLVVDGMLRVKNLGEQYTGGAITTQVIEAQLEHSASVQGGANPAGKFLDSEIHYYNNWGAASWAAQAYNQFKLDIPQGDELTKGEYVITVNCGGSKDGRNLDVNYMPVATPRITTQSSIPELTTFVGTSVASYNDIKRSYQTKTIDVTKAVLAMLEAGQDYIIFVMSNGAAGGNIYGKASGTNAPKLKLTIKHYPSGIESVSTERVQSSEVYDIMGRRTSNMMQGQIYRLNGKLIIKK